MKTVKFNQSYAGLNFSYTINEIVKMEKAKANSLIRLGIAADYSPAPADVVITHPAPATSTPAVPSDSGNELPADCPAHDILVEAGLTTVEDVLNHDDLTMLKGIGDAMKKNILEFLKSE